MGIVEDEQNAARRALAAAVQKIADGQAERDAALARCRDARISITEIATVCRVTRETVYRWLKEGDGRWMKPDASSGKPISR